MERTFKKSYLGHFSSNRFGISCGYEGLYSLSYRQVLSGSEPGYDVTIFLKFVWKTPFTWQNIFFKIGFFKFFVQTFRDPWTCYYASFDLILCTSGLYFGRYWQKCSKIWPFWEGHISISFHDTWMQLRGKLVESYLYQMLYWPYVCIVSLKSSPDPENSPIAHWQKTVKSLQSWSCKPSYHKFIKPITFKMVHMNACCPGRALINIYDSTFTDDVIKKSQNLKKRHSLTWSELLKNHISIVS